MTVRMSTVIADGAGAAETLVELDRRLTTFDAPPDFVFVFYGERHDDAALVDLLRRRLPGAHVIGGTSGDGLVDAGGLTEPGPIGLLTVTDPDGSFGVGFAEFGDDPAAAAAQALRDALADADAVGELPELIWVYQTPGCEEAVLDGLQSLVGDRCPIVGGTAVDDNIDGRWRVLHSGGVLAAGVVVAVLFSSGGIGVAFQGGYEPVGRSGVVTGIGESQRGVLDDGASNRIVTIDGRPAAEVYDEWRGGILRPDWRESGQDIKDLTANDPLGVELLDGGGVTYFRLLQPGMVLEDGSLYCFASVRRGDEVHVMRGSTAGLVRRAASVVASATGAVRRVSDGVAGGIVIYCAGCRTAVGDDIGRVVGALRDGFDGRPFLGCFTGGEQGPVLGHAIHANLMISAVIFGE